MLTMGALAWTNEKNQDRIGLRREEMQKIGTVTQSVGFKTKQNNFIDYKPKTFRPKLLT